MKIMKTVLFLCFLLVFIWITSLVQTDPSTRRDLLYYVASLFFILSLFYMLFVKDKAIIGFIFVFLLGTTNLLGAYIGWNWGFLLGVFILGNGVAVLYSYLTHVKEKEEEEKN